MCASNNEGIATRNKCIASSNKCLTPSNKKKTKILHGQTEEPKQTFLERAGSASLAHQTEEVDGSHVHKKG